MSIGDAVWSKKTVLGGGRRAKITLFLESCFRFSSFLTVFLSLAVSCVCACRSSRERHAAVSTHTHTHERVYGSGPPTKIAFPAAGAHYSISELRNKNEMPVFLPSSYGLQEGVLVLSFYCNGEAVARRFFLYFPLPER